MGKSAINLARDLVAAGPGGLEELRVHTFDDESAHDDVVVERLYTEFSGEVDGVAEELNKDYGPPIRTGTANDEAIPLNGVFRFGVWDIDGTELFVAAAHEDRGVPILLMVGTALQDAA